MTTISSISIEHLEIPFRARFSHSLATRSTSCSILLGLHLDDGSSGWGECLPRDYVTGETIGETMGALESSCKTLIGKDISDSFQRHPERGFPSLSPRLESLLKTSPSARCALELALFDAQGASQHTSLLELFATSTPTEHTPELRYSAVISGEEPSKVEALLERAAMFRFTQLKLKVGLRLEDDLENIRACRRLCGDEIEIRVDANAAWSLDQAATAIKAMMDMGVFIFEQPLPVALDACLPSLRARTGTRARLLVDESLCGAKDAARHIEQGIIDGFNLKLSKLGGLGPALTIHEMARSAGLTCQLGAHVGETSLLASAGAALASLARDLTALEGCYAPLLLESDITHRPLMFGEGGSLTRLLGTRCSGLGVEVDHALIAPWVKRRLDLHE